MDKVVDTVTVPIVDKTFLRGKSLGDDVSLKIEGTIKSLSYDEDTERAHVTVAIDRVEEVGVVGEEGVGKEKAKESTGAEEFGRPGTEEERKERHFERLGTEELPPRGTVRKLSIKEMIRGPIRSARLMPKRREEENV